MKDETKRRSRRATRVDDEDDAAIAAAGSRVSWDQWMEWKHLCDSARCQPATRNALNRYGKYVFDTHLLAALALTQRAGVQSPDHGDPKPYRAWAMFEGHLVADRMKSGKAYKDWLFEWVENAQNPPALLWSNAGRLMRDVVRRYVRDSQRKGREESLDRPVYADNPAGPTVMDLLPPDSLLPSTVFGDSARDDIYMREYLCLAKKEATLFLGEMDEQEKLAVMADALGVSLANPEVIRIARCGKNSLYEAFKAVAARIRARIDTKYTSEQGEAMALICELTALEVMELCISWGRAEKRFGRIFLLVNDSRRNPIS